MPRVERAQPWLGTLVTIRALAVNEAVGQEAVSEAFEEIASVHRLMSFHAAHSDVSELNRDAAQRPVTVHGYTLDVLRQALALSAESDGCFDVCVGARLVRAGLLPEVPGAVNRDRVLDGSWRDVAILLDGRVSFKRPLWIDLGGIAKGYAVDRAIGCLRRHGIVQACVNAGGDLRVYGPHPELVYLRVDTACGTPAAMELRDGSAASSSGHLLGRWAEGRLCGPHFDGAHGSPSRTDRFVCVLAGDCILADALTKVVIALGNRSSDILYRHGACAHLHDPEHGWAHLNEGCVQ